MRDSELIEALRAVAERHAPDWQVRIAGRAGERATVELELRHPASHGLDFTLPTNDRDPAAWLDRVLSCSQELEVVAAAPLLEHPDLVMGIRSLVDAFGWESQEVRGLAFLLHEASALTGPEAAWLAGFCGDGAPMESVSPWRDESAPDC